MTHYHTYIRSQEWRNRKLDFLAAAGYRCEQCGADYWLGNMLEAHHVHYQTLGHERPGDVRVLCRQCHQEQHQPTGG